MSGLRVMVCGGAGYIGSHMVKMLMEHGHHPIVFDNLSSGHAEAIPDECFVRGDLMDPSALRRILAEHTFDAVMHFAGRIIVPESVTDPGGYYGNNVIGTWNLLEAMRAEGLQRFVFSSTAAVYGNPVMDRITETHPLAPLNPYGRTKLQIEDVLADYAHAYGFRSVAFRYFNAAGADPSAEIGEAHDPETHLVPNILRAALGSGPELKLFGDDYDTPDGTCVRDYVHVNDLCDAHLRALTHMQQNEGAHIFNLGNGNGFSVKEVLDAATEVTGREIPHTMAPRRDGDSAALVADASKARKELAWEPAFTDVRSIIETAWRWHSDQKF